MRLRSPDLSSPSERHDDSDNDDIWEDVTPNQPCKRSESPSSQSQSHPRRRRAVKTVFIATSPPRRRTTKTTRSASASRAGTATPTPETAPPMPELPEPVVEPNSVISTAKITNAVSTGARYTGSYVLGVCTSAIGLLRRPLSFVLFLWLLVTLLARMNNTLRAAFAPVCYLPGVSRSAFCAPPPSPSAPRWADFPHLMDSQSDAFEELLHATTGGSALALEIKKTEMATVDLSTLVRVSDLHSRDLIADTLSDFVEDARKTGRGLQRLSAKVNGAVDGILAVNDYALHTIEGAAARPPSRIGVALSLIPFVDMSGSAPTQELVTQTFTEAMDYLAVSLARLVVEAQASLSNLDALEQRLNTLNEVIARENVALSLAQTELLAELWTKLGGNRRKLQGHGDHLALLKGLGHYRRRALVHVVGALTTLQAMSEDMQDMRERVAAPELAGSRVPVEVHIRSIRSGLERLKQGRVKAKEREEEAIRRILTI
ncbi:hypothetical protein FIBSPDRAFT_795515, partial [Athelia psychrophila]